MFGVCAFSHTSKHTPYIHYSSFRTFLRAQKVSSALKSFQQKEKTLSLHKTSSLRKSSRWARTSRAGGEAGWGRHRSPLPANSSPCPWTSERGCFPRSFTQFPRSSHRKPRPRNIKDFSQSQRASWRQARTPHPFVCFPFLIFLFLNFPLYFPPFLF